MIEDLEPGGLGAKAAALAHELREIADMLERMPELADEPDPFAAAQRLIDDLAGLDVDTDDVMPPGDDEEDD